MKSLELNNLGLVEISKAEAKTINGGTSLPSSFAFSFSFGTGGGFTFTLESGFNYFKKK